MVIFCFVLLCMCVSSDCMFIVIFKLSIYKGKVTVDGCIRCARCHAKYCVGITSSNPRFIWTCAVASSCFQTFCFTTYFSYRNLNNLSGMQMRSYCSSAQNPPVASHFTSTKSQMPHWDQACVPRIPPQPRWLIFLFIKYDKSVSTIGSLHCFLVPLSWDIWMIGFFFFQIPVQIEFKSGEPLYIVHMYIVEKILNIAKYRIEHVTCNPTIDF